MIVKVLLLAFNTNKVRFVYIPDNAIDDETDTMDIVNQAFYFGQNDVQPMEIRSVSTGDVVCANGQFFLCNPIGWTPLEEVIQ
jgi:hypothetical protein